MTDFLEWLHTLHSAQGIAQIVAAGGLAVLVAIIFAETGLLVGFFLPGDSLLITAGVLANTANPNHIAGLDIITMNIALIIAAVAGDQVGYLLGHKAGDNIWQRPDSKFFKRSHLVAAHEFYEKYGGISVIAARYIPIMRTFVPFLAGVARMPYRAFVSVNVFGGILWITSLLWLGYYLGGTKLANRLDKLIVLVIVVSLIPIVVGFIKKLGKRSKV